VNHGRTLFQVTPLTHEYSLPKGDGLA